MGKAQEMQRTLATHVQASFGQGTPAVGLPPGLNPAEAQRMPPRLQGTTKARDALVIPTDKIQPDPDQPREDFDDESIERLAESLKTRGQLQPIRVRYDEARQAWVILAGERRWRAAVRAGMPTLTCMVHDAPLAPADVLALQLVENALREDLKPVEQARAFKKLIEANGWSANQLARELAITPSSISRTLSLLELPGKVQEQVDAGELAVRAAAEISRLPDPDEQLALAVQAVAEGLTRDQVMDTVKARRLGKAKAEPGGRREFKYPDGAKVGVTLSPGMSGTAAVVEILQRALKDARAELRASTRQDEAA